MRPITRFFFMILRRKYFLEGTFMVQPFSYFRTEGVLKKNRHYETWSVQKKKSIVINDMDKNMGAANAYKEDVILECVR